MKLPEIKSDKVFVSVLVIWAMLFILSVVFKLGMFIKILPLLMIVFLIYTIFAAIIVSKDGEKKDEKEK